MATDVRVEARDLIADHLVQERLHHQIYPHDEPAHPLTAFDLGPLLHERHPVHGVPVTVRLCVLRHFADKEIRVIRGEPEIPQCRRTRVQRQSFDRRTRVL